jgi:broad specificity phosphatase PhoE
MIYVARHCSTEFNTQGRLQGSLDVPLSSDGHRQASEYAKTLPLLGIQRIIASPLRRAMETAGIYAQHLGVPLEADTRLREIDHGDWEGERFQVLLEQEKSPYRLWLADPASAPIPNGTETAEAAQKRALDCVRDTLANHPSETLLLVTHKHLKAALFCAAHGLPFARFVGQIRDSVEADALPSAFLERLSRPPSSGRT